MDVAQERREGRGAHDAPAGGLPECELALQLALHQRVEGLHRLGWQRRNHEGTRVLMLKPLAKRAPLQVALRLLAPPPQPHAPLLVLTPLGAQCDAQLGVARGQRLHGVSLDVAQAKLPREPQLFRLHCRLRQQLAHALQPRLELHERQCRRPRRRIRACARICHLDRFDGLPDLQLNAEPLCLPRRITDDVQLRGLLEQREDGGAPTDRMRMGNQTRTDIGSDSKPTMVLFNKVDLLNDPEGERTPNDLECGIRERFEALGHDVMFLSAKTKVGYDAFRATLYKRVKELHVKRYPYNQFLY